jgi:hypothetical protein
MRTRELAPALLLASLVGTQGARAVPPPPPPGRARFEGDLRGVDLADCDRAARARHGFFFVKAAGDYERGQRPRFRIRPEYGAPGALVACVQDRFARYQKSAPVVEGDDLGERRTTMYRALPLGDRRDILPAGPRVVALLRRPAVPAASRRRLGPGIALAGGRCLVTEMSDLVGRAFRAWLEANFPQKLPLGEDDPGAERFGVDESWLLDVRSGIEEGWVACLVPTAPLARRLAEVRELIDTSDVMVDDLDRRALHVTWTLDRERRARSIQSCVGPRGPGQARASATDVAKLRAELASRLAEAPLPTGKPGDRFAAIIGPWHAISTRRLTAGQAGLPPGCAH